MGYIMEGGRVGGGGTRIWAKALQGQVMALNTEGKGQVKEVISSLPPVGVSPQGEEDRARQSKRSLQNHKPLKKKTNPKPAALLEPLPKGTGEATARQSGDN